VQEKFSIMFSSWGPHTKLRDLLDAIVPSGNAQKLSERKTNERLFELGMGGPQPALSLNTQDRKSKRSSITNSITLERYRNT
jgi:hypothetical protein